MLDIDDIKQAVPAHLKTAVTPSLVHKVNSVAADPLVAQNIRDNFVTYAVVLKEGKFRAEDYLNAVTYVTYKVMGYTNEESYARTFPERHKNLLADGKSKKDISAYVSAYNKGKLVNLILEQTLIPNWVMYQDVYQKAIMTQAELMVTANSEKVRSDAANSILTHLKKPETKEVDLNLNVSDTSGMSELKEMLNAVAERQVQAIEQGVPTQEIAHQSLKTVNAIDVIDGEFVEIEKEK